MKTLIILVLAVIATQAANIDYPGTTDYYYPNATEIESLEAEFRPVARSAGVNVGTTFMNRLLDRVNVRRDAKRGEIIAVDVTHRTNSAVTIRGIQALVVGAPQSSTARIIRGGLGQTSVTIRLESARGRGFHYQCSFWGR